ncbi:RIP metalloprotease RseP [Pseudolabrys taiwanensis]|uniref:Zinc metalloprotease n=1 Tax=Pseudolabrys taiwanensis TaxID=331696 RepID=A0A345ZSE2_9HYPH|nr:RIP metalloprotease RseP [Pseudolabrys taiwanensis]AXK79839.1 RIP metalloprotease RseP [Pseudolabrys taiwanensis]
MDIMASLSAFGGGLIGYLVPFLFVLTIVVFFHELGHFLVARWRGVKVIAFSIGFGPEVAGFNDRHGTRWKLSAIPLGGYVKFLGDDNAASVPDHDAAATMSDDEKKVSFIHKPVGSRAAVVAAGPIANFILAILIFAGIFMTAGKQITSARVDQVQPNSAAAAAGFQPGDLVVAIGKEKIDSFSDMQRIVSISAGEPLEVQVERGGTQVTLKATPELREIKDNFGNVHRVGVLGISRSMAPGDVKTQTYSPVGAVIAGAQETWFVVDRTLSYIGGIFAGREAADQLGGPIRIAQVSGQVATAGFVALLHLTAVLSVSIGLLNLFPIPLLDGGHLLFYAIEAARGRPLSERAQEVGFRIGLAIVVMLMIFATFNDILHLATS